MSTSIVFNEIIHDLIHEDEVKHFLWDYIQLSRARLELDAVQSILAGVFQVKAEVAIAPPESIVHCVLLAVATAIDS